MEGRKDNVFVKPSSDGWQNKNEILFEKMNFMLEWFEGEMLRKREFVVFKGK